MGSAPIESSFHTVAGRRVHTLEVNRPPPGSPKQGAKKTTIVFLHGQAFSAEVWRQTGTLDLLDSRGIHAVAVDLPGHGVTGGQPLPPEQRGAFLHELLRQLGARQPLVLVTPSMSGSYAEPFISQHIGELEAWVAIAPVGLKAWVESSSLPAEEARKGLKVVSMYGDRDGMRADYALIEDAFPTTAQFVLIRDAGHACYVDQPEIFHRELLRLLDNEITP